MKKILNFVYLSALMITVIAMLFLSIIQDKASALFAKTKTKPLKNKISKRTTTYIITDKAGASA